MEPFAVIDGHNDLAWAHRKAAGYDLDRVELDRDQPQFQTDLPRLRRGGVGGQFWSVWVPTSLEGDAAVRATLEQIEFVHRMIERYPQRLQLALGAEEAEAALERGRIASLLGAEGGHSIDSSLPMLRLLYRLGVRYLTLAHNRNVGWADSCTDQPQARGLTEFGEQVVEEMNRLGMLVDISHVSPDTARAALAVSRAPVIFSHSSCSALCDHPRNVPDDVIRLLGDNGGTMMITFVPSFVSQECRDWERGLEEQTSSRGLVPFSDDFDRFRLEWEGEHPAPRATVEQVADHLDHARELLGAEHLGLGGDYDGSSHFPEGLSDVSCYPNLFRVLQRRKWSEGELSRLAHANILETMRGAEEVARGGELQRG